MASQDAVVENLYLSFARQMTRLHVQPSTLKFKDLADVPYQPHGDHSLPRNDRYALDNSWAGNLPLLSLQSTGCQLWLGLGDHSLQEWRDCRTEVLTSLQTIDSICQRAWNEQRSCTFGKDDRRHIDCGELSFLRCYPWPIFLVSFLS